MKFTKKDVGCWADGVGGHAHIRAKLAELVSGLDAEPVAQAALVSALRDEMSDDAWEEDAALEWLQEYTGEGLVWEFHDGDLMLSELEEEEEEEEDIMPSVEHHYGAYIIRGHGRDPEGELIQTDWEYPRAAESLGWNLRRVQPGKDGARHLKRAPKQGCDHRSSDGTVDCPCGVTAADFIRAAGEFLDSLC